MNQGKKRMRENSPGLRFLKELFESGDVTATEAPREVRGPYAELREYEPKSFGDTYRKYNPQQGEFICIYMHIHI